MLRVNDEGKLPGKATKRPEGIIVAHTSPAGAAVHLVEGAGHAGVTDDRLDLRRVMRSWRDAG